jgi:type II secretory pathway pseudopilin PulG
MNSRFFRRATTMVELLVVMGIMILTLSGIYRFFSSIGKVQKDLSNQVILQMDARRVFDLVADQVQAGSEIVRPYTGETLPYIIFKNMINETTILYLEPNNILSKQLEKPVYKLISYTNDYSHTYKKDREKTLAESVKRLSFTSLSPNSIQTNVTVMNPKGEYQFLAHLGLMNIGGLE